MAALRLETPLFSAIPSIGQRFSKRLDKLGIKTVHDLIWHFPTRYEDFSQIHKIADLEPGEAVTVRGAIGETKLRRTWRRRFSVAEAMISDDSGSIKAVWFNQPYVLNTLRTGRLANFSGKVSISNESEIYLNNPAYELATKDKEQETRHTGRLVPIYQETKGLTSRGLRFLIQPILKNLERLSEWLPTDVLQTNKLPEINRALRDIHFPKKIEEALVAQKRFAFEDLFLLQLWNVGQKMKLAREKAPIIKTDIENLKKIIAKLPFELTLSQKKSLWEIIQDIGGPQPMNRLLQGDVGSGKTVVAALAAIIAAKSGLTTAFMAPTEVLASQHFETLKKLFLKIDLPDQPVAGLLTSSNSKILYETDLEQEANKEDLRSRIKNGEIKIVIGTHALIQKSITFENPGLVIVDEQHRFGVRQRAALLRDPNITTNTPDAFGSSGRATVPHFLSMSATPIPRTLMLTIFGDLDISAITELPRGRKNITTKVVPPEKRNEAYGFIREQIKNGRQAFVICPRIDQARTNADLTQTDTDNTLTRTGTIPRASARHQSTLDTKSVVEEYEKLSKKVFPDLRVAMLHGQMKSKEKEAVMKRFMNGETDILVSTSVVEVGVDVPNATIMMIEGSERFGLAQLYQFRGRVGRGEHQSYCFLLAESSGRITRERLQAIIQAKNGFELAEIDLKIRGPGEFLGTTQTGLPDVAMQGLKNMELVKSSREAAVKTLSNDKDLKKYPALKSKLDIFRKKIHPE